MVLEMDLDMKSQTHSFQWFPSILNEGRKHWDFNPDPDLHLTGIISGQSTLIKLHSIHTGSETNSEVLVKRLSFPRRAITLTFLKGHLEIMWSNLKELYVVFLTQKNFVSMAKLKISGCNWLIDDKIVTMESPHVNW